MAIVDEIYIFRKVPYEMKEMLHTVVYACDKLQVKELLDVKKQLGLKFGKSFIQDAEQNREQAVNLKILEKTSSTVPIGSSIRELVNIANEFGIQFDAQSLIKMHLEPRYRTDFHHVVEDKAVRTGTTGYSVNFEPPTQHVKTQETQQHILPTESTIMKTDIIHQQNGIFF